MAASYNKVILAGNLTRDPELRYTPSGTAVCDLGLAINDRRKGTNGEWVDETTFVDVTLWMRQAEVASEYLTKGSNVLIEGRLKLDSWEANDGQKRSKLKVVGEKMQMLGGKAGGGGGGGGGGRSSAPSDDDYAPPADNYEPSSGGRSSGGRPGGGSKAPPPDDDIPF